MRNGQFQYVFASIVACNIQGATVSRGGVAGERTVAHVHADGGCINGTANGAGRAVVRKGGIFHRQFIARINGATVFFRGVAGKGNVLSVDFLLRRVAFLAVIVAVIAAVAAIVTFVIGGSVAALDVAAFGVFRVGFVRVISAAGCIADTIAVNAVVGAGIAAGFGRGVAAGAGGFIALCSIPGCFIGSVIRCRVLQGKGCRRGGHIVFFRRRFGDL